VTIFEEQSQPGGRLLRETTPEELPRDVLAAEIGLILRLGVELRAATRVTGGTADSGLGTEAGAQGAVCNRQSPIPNPQPLIPLRQLCREFDAVLLACGHVANEQVEQWGLKPAAHGILVDKETFRTSLPGVFAAGNAIRAKGMVVRSVADGREAAAVISRQLSVASGQVSANRQPPTDNCQLATGNRQLTGVSRIGKLEPGEVAGLVSLAAPAARQDADRARGFSPIEAVQQAGRCLHCDCRALSTCKLRRYAAIYGARPGRFHDQRRPVRQLAQPSGVIYEPGKCIDCGLCIQIATAANEPLGLTFVGRGFDVRVGVPFDRSLEEALGRVAAECIAACPTGALAWK
jgi:ferredoxin